jgi:copper chaperone CopZ
MAEKTFTAPAISCHHCTNTIQNELSELPGVEAVEANPQTKQVMVRWQEPADWPQIQALLEEIGYPPAP